MQTGAVILAGGLARRMQGRDKGLVSLAGRPLVDWVLERVRPQVEAIVINANRNTQAYEQLGEQVVGDSLPGHLGPLAGLLTGLQSLPQESLFMCPCDSPFLPLTMVSRLRHGLMSDDADIAVAHDGVRMQPVFCLVRRTVQPSLSSFLDSGERKIDRWFATQRTTTVDFSDEPDAFRNINTETERLDVERSLSI